MKNLIVKNITFRKIFVLLSAIACLLIAQSIYAADTNTREGKDALKNDHGPNSGQSNSAFGYDALYTNTNGSDNTATGYSALYQNVGGYANTATGFQAMLQNTSGILNTAIGANALLTNSTGYLNTAVGTYALFNNTGGNGNTALGSFALASLSVPSSTGSNNTAVGDYALRGSQVGSYNIAIGYSAANFAIGDNNIDIGNVGAYNESNTIRIGQQVPAVAQPVNDTLAAHTATFIAGIYGSTTSSGVAVYINSDGKLGTLTSSARFKTDIKPMDKTSETILELKPVTFRYKSQIDPKAIPQFGLVAEDVEKVNPDLVARDAQGKVYTVRYEAVNAMLLNEFLKEHRKVQELETIAARQQTSINALTNSLKQQASQMEKINAQIQLIRSNPATVANNN